MSPHYRYGRPTIGVLIGSHVYWTPGPYSSLNSYLNEIFRGIDAAVHHLGCNLLLACGIGSPSERSNLTRPAWPTLGNDTDFVPVGPWNTDGLIVINPIVSRNLSQYIHALREAGHPVVFIADGEEGPTIVADNAGGISQAIRHFVEHGHQHIAYIAGTSADVRGDGSGRVKAYRSAVKQFKLANDPQLFAYGDHTFEGGYAAMQRILVSGVSFTAVLASNDESAMGAMRALKEAGLQIPQQIAVIGFDDWPETVAQEPPLTSVHVPRYKLGYQAVDILLQYIHGQQRAPRSFKIPTRLATRRSCGCYSDPLPILVTPASTIPPVDFAGHKSKIVLAIVEAVLAETQRFDSDEAKTLSERLIDTFMLSLKREDSASFQQLVEQLLTRAEAEDDDTHLWQGVISILRQEVPVLVDAAQRPSAQQFALDILDQARKAISERTRRQRSRSTLDQKWLTNRIGYLTARLLMTSDVLQIFEVLGRDLPAMGIPHTSLSFFESDGADPVGWSVLHAITDHETVPVRFPTRQFPPEGLYPSDQPFSLALLPLVGPAGQVGFVSYDSINMELDGPITQQIAAALNNARLYAEATEGRKLAEEANSLKSRFLSTVSHELRTPLNLIVGLSEILLQKPQHGKPTQTGYRKDIEQIYASAQHLGRLIRDVLDLASSEVGQLRLSNELLDLGETLQMVAATGRQLADEKGLAWRELLPAARLWVWGDRTRLRQVALNMVSNAVKFTSHGEVSLQIQIQDDGKATVLVSDTGPGIAREEQTFIFDEFRRSEQAAVQGHAGLGLGLAISKRLVEMHGGEIGVRSSGKEGAGSTFYFTLPLIEPEAIRDEKQLLPLGLEEMVLLLTTRSGSGERLRDHLVQKGFEVKMVQIDQEDGWFPPLLKTPPGAVVLDMAIVPTQGWNVLRMLKGNLATRTIPLLFYSLAKDKGAMLELDTLTKPVGTSELAQALEHQQMIGDKGQAEKVFLIVDDDPATLEMHARIVQSYSAMHKVLRARNGREALEAIKRQRPDLVLLDLMMPELDGFRVLEVMRGNEGTRDIPVIVLTGQILTEKEMARLNRGVATVLAKGLFSVEETLTHIDAALARKRKLSSATQRLVRQAMAHIHEHYAGPISRQDLARHLGVTSDYLTICFRREVGLTFVAYLNRYRVNRAKLLLSESDKSIAEIAIAVGFANSSYFGRIFRQQVGITPEAYRRT